MKHLSLLFLVVFLFSCGNEDGDCSGELICTTEYRTILVEVLNADGTRVIFDEFTVTNLQTNEVIDLDWESGDLYPITDDSMRHELPADG